MEPDRRELEVDSGSAEVSRKKERNRRRHRRINVSIDTPYILSDGYCIITYVNQCFLDLTGYVLKELVGKNYIDTFVLEEEKLLFREHMASMVKSSTKKRDPLLNDHRIVIKDGSLLFLHLDALYYFKNDRPEDGVDYYYVIVTDRTEDHRVKAELEKKTALLKAQVAASRDAQLVTDSNNNKLTINSLMISLFSIPDAIIKDFENSLLLNHVLKFVKNPEIFEEWVIYLNETKTEKGTTEIELLSGIFLEMYSAPVVSETGKFLGRIWTFQDKTRDKQMMHDLEKSRQQYRELCITDNLTGLRNQRHFYDLLQQEIKNVNDFDQHLSLLLFDIDLFKTINDSYGHKKGDLILSRFAKIVKDIIKEVGSPTDSPNRYGGEEFAVIMPTKDIFTAYKMAETIRKRLANFPFTTESGESVKVTVSGGVAEYKKGETMDGFFVRADKALYQAKASGRNQIIYSPFPNDL